MMRTIIGIGLLSVLHTTTVLAETDFEFPEYSYDSTEITLFRQ